MLTCTVSELSIKLLGAGTMTTKNDITGDPIQTKISDQKKYTDNYDAVFGKKEKKEVEPTPVKDNKPALPNGLEKHWKK
jgi:hypothetical protein